jgi:radical SAM protein (TIGR01212 family)
MEKYNIYSQYLKNKYGKKVYKLPIFTVKNCPNRDGTLAFGGCDFCDEDGSGFNCLSSQIPIKEQIQKNKEFYKKRYKAQLFIAYFQPFSNTYLPLEDFKKNILSASEESDIVEIAISTRPDCINDKYLDFLQEIQETKNIEINIEVGLQTVNYQILENINRQHTLAEFIDAILRIKAKNLATTAHLMLNLPEEKMIDVIESAKIVSALKIDFVKLHSLYIVQGSQFAKKLQKKELKICTKEDYIDRVVTFLEYLDPNIVIQRLVARGPKYKTIFENWGQSWWSIKQEIEDTLEKRNTLQGKKFDYLNGKAIRIKFL